MQLLTIIIIYAGEEEEMVPIASWVCLCVGLFLSLLILAKPLWWDRFRASCLSSHKTRAGDF